MNARKPLLTKTLLTVVTAGVAVSTLGTVAASAATHPATYPLRSVSQLDYRPDSGGNGNWALDNITRTVTFREIGVSAGVYTYVAQLSDRGEFTTDLGAYTPNQGGAYAGEVIHGQVTGPMSGSASFEFTASNPISSHARNLGVPAAAFGAYGSTSTWYELAFPAGTTFGGLGIGNWGWTYKASVPEYKYVRVAVLDPKTHKQVINPKTHKPEFRTVKVSYVLNERWADTSAPANAAGQGPRAGNIIGA